MGKRCAEAFDWFCAGRLRVGKSSQPRDTPSVGTSPHHHGIFGVPCSRLCHGHGFQRPTGFFEQGLAQPLAIEHLIGEVSVSQLGVSRGRKIGSNALA
jgi:hypothetical protein